MGRNSGSKREGLRTEKRGKLDVGGGWRVGINPDSLGIVARNLPESSTTVQEPNHKYFALQTSLGHQAPCEVMLAGLYFPADSSKTSWWTL